MVLTPYIGQALLLGSLLASTLYVFIPLSWIKKYPQYLYAFQPLFLILAFGWLLKGHMTSDFSLLNVVQNSHTQKPWLYKIAGTWGNHEGSMLLWTLLTAVVGGLAFGCAKQRSSTSLPLLIFSLLNFSFVLFLILACDPFAAIAIIPLEGNDLNPLLQDPLLAIHPPFLYFGYVSTAVLFVHALLPSIHLKHWHFWTLISWTSLTLGLGMGSFWAYYELGWGGWWFWDPVENIALIPWLLLTALLHTILLQRLQDQSLVLIRWLSYFAFASCLGGTLMVRSGLLTSVHSFAIDPERGILLAILLMFILLPGGWVVLKGSSHSKDTPLHSLLVLTLPFFVKLGILFLILGALIVAFGTLYPLILEVFDQSITVGAPYFKTTFIPIMLPILGLLALHPWLKPKTENPLLLQQSLSSFLLAVLFVIGGVFLEWLPLSWNLIILVLGVWVLSSMMQSYLRAPLKKNFPLKKMAMVFSHGGLAITILGMVLTTVLETEFLVSLKEGESTQLAGHILTLTRMTPHEGPNYRAQRALLTSDCGPLVPEKRFYWTQKIIHNETSIRSTLFHHLYVALGEHYDNNSWGFRIYHKPWINLIWMGIILMVCGGLLGIYRRRAGLMTILMGAFLWAPAHALEVHEALPLKVLEIRAKALGDQLICPTCAGQSLNDSAADEAQLLREIIRQKILKGESDQQIIQWFVERYGNRVLFKPPLTPLTYLLWGFPWMLLGGGGVYVMGRVFRSGSQSANLNT